MDVGERADRLCGVLLGTALGDALGLPLEGLRAETIRRRFPAPAQRFHLVGSTGYVSDDTEQSALVAEALLRGGGDAALTLRCFRRLLRGWFLRLPFGIGWSTLKACVRLWLGFKLSGSRSAGNGAAMRAAIVGASLCDDAAARRSLSEQLARVTHTDPRAVEGAVFTAELAAISCRSDAASPRAALVERALAAVSCEALRAAIERGLALAAAQASVADAAAQLGNSGFIVHTLALAVYCFASTDSVMAAIERALLAGGDTDTIAAIVGAWAGAQHGDRALPAALLARIQDGPFGPTHLRQLGQSLAWNAEPPRWSAWAAFARNLALYPVVLAHGLRRMLG